MTVWDRNFVLLIIALLFVLAGCGMVPLRLHPLLVEHNGGRELTDEQVDIRIDRPGFLGTQAACIADDPLAALVVPIMSCQRMACAEHKLWTTEKKCTCQIWLWAEWALAEEIKHCRGWQDIFY